MTWNEVYRDASLKWEVLKKEKNLYSFRFSQKYRAIASRDGVFMFLHEIHVDHDGAYI
jgi:hypothetical protein